MNYQQNNTTHSDKIFMSSVLNSIKTDRIYELPSKYNERTRYLPAELTGKSGYVDYNYTPYHREIVDNFSPISPVREVAVVKPSQIGFTTMVLESLINYHIGSYPRPMVYVTADNELAEKGMETKVERMIDSAGLRELIKTQSGQKTKKTGDRKTEKEFKGGFLHAIGALNPGKLRSMSYPIGLVDEFDAFPAKLKNEGSPEDLLKNRIIIPYESNYKILYGSTPLVTQTSKIIPLYNQGDQRNYFVPCLNCGEMIVLHWHLKESQTDTGDEAGIIFEVMESGRLIEDSVFYKCQKCGGHMVNDQKTVILKEGGWLPTAEAIRPELRSYWLNSLYSPVGMFSWEGMVKSFLECWDVKKGRVKDREKYRSFRNTKEGKGFEELGEGIKYERVVQFQRNYSSNTIPNKMCIEDNGKPILLLNGTVDVQDKCLFVDIKGYTTGGISYTIDFRKLDGDTQNPKDQCWTRLKKIIEEEDWTADDGKKYFARTWFIDSADGDKTKIVYDFCKQIKDGGVYPIFGSQWLTGDGRGITYKEASKKTIEGAGCIVYNINTTITKNRVSDAFKQDWNAGTTQPDWRPNFPEDFRDDYFRQFEAEYKVQKLEPSTGRFLGMIWKQVEGRDNHAFDTFGYSVAALELLAEYACKNRLGLDSLNWVEFWKFAEGGFYYEN